MHRLSRFAFSFALAGSILGCAPDQPATADVKPDVRQTPTDTARQSADPIEAPLEMDSTWSPDSTKVAWFKHWPATDSTEIWLGNRDGRSPVRLTGQHNESDEIIENKTRPVYRPLQFNHDGTQLVTLTAYWVVSGRVVLIDLMTKKEVPIEVGANEIVPLNGGRYAGMYILYQGRIGAEEVGRRYGYWLYTRDFDEVKKVADDDGIKLARWLIRNKALVEN